MANRNPIHDLLGAIGLPWLEARADLARRCGVRRHPAYLWDVIEVATSPAICEGLLWPLSAQVFEPFSPAFPAARFSSVAWFGDDAYENLRRTEARFREALGPLRRREASANSIQPHVVVRRGAAAADGLACRHAVAPHGQPVP